MPRPSRLAQIMVACLVVWYGAGLLARDPGRVPGGALVFRADDVTSVTRSANTDPDHPLFELVRHALAAEPGEVPPGMATAMPAQHSSLPAWMPARCQQFAALFEIAGAKHGVDPALLLAVAIAESGCQPHVTSYANAQGMMQIVPRWHGTRDWYNPTIAVDYAAQLLAGLRSSKGSWDRAIYSYNSGNIRTAEGDRYLRYVGGMWSEAQLAESPTFYAWCSAGSGFGLEECSHGANTR